MKNPPDKKALLSIASCTPSFVLLLVGLSLGALTITAHGATPDPLHSPQWDVVEKEHYRGARIVADARVKAMAPGVAEDPLNVPVAVDVSALPDVKEVQVLADLNPIVKVLQFYPGAGKPYLAFRLKLQQSSPIRVMARTGDGVWHMGGLWVTTTGGGCTAPSAGSGQPLWQSQLNAVQGRVWAAGREGQRVRARIIHPMDTGLAAGIPAFYIQQLQLTDSAGLNLMAIETFEPIAENPVFTFDVAGHAAPGPLLLTGQDNNGNKIRAELAQ